MQHQVNRRRTGQQSFASGRNEPDVIKIVSGIFEGKTTGAPICILLDNQDARPSDYDALKDVYRPGHADFTYEAKYGIRDHRGGGRSSIRITAPLVAAGELALQILKKEIPIKVKAYVSQIGQVSLTSAYQTLDLENIDTNDVRCPDGPTAAQMQNEIQAAHTAGDTLGGCITCVIQALPPGIGSPVFEKLQAALAHAMLSINTVKGFEYGSGFLSAGMKGSEHNDAYRMSKNGIQTKTNHDGGIQGGISNGMDIYFKVAFKPISSISLPQTTINHSGVETVLNIEGRHDACAVPRAVPIVEAYTNIVLADLYLQHKYSKI